jgi:hypothetical protein
MRGREDSPGTFMTLTKTLAAAAALALIASPAYAQNLNTGATGTYGSVQLRSGYQPDPYTVSVTAGGPIESTRADESCTAGYVAQRPSFTLRYTAGELPLYIGAVSDADTTIIVRTPNGEWVCNDDGGGALNPLVSWEEPRSGRYQIWVGRFGTQNETAPASVHISEVGGPSAAQTGDGPDFSLEPAYGQVDLTGGFTPDPHTVAIDAGGTIDASVLNQPGCVGRIARAPDFRLNWTAGSGALPLIFSVASDSDTTLVINDAQGNWVCDDDGGEAGLNPSIRFESPASGQYDVWVGTYSEGDLQPSTLNISELTTQ